MSDASKQRQSSEIAQTEAQTSMTDTTAAAASVPQGAEGIPVDHQPYVQQIIKMDPYDDVPGPVTITGNPRPLGKMKASGLSEEMRAPILAKLHSVPDAQREEVEDRLVKEAIRAKRAEIRVRTGLGEGALPYHREQVELARQVQDLVSKRTWFTDELAKVSGYETRTDPATGQPVPQEVLAIQDPRRRAGYAERITDIDRQLRLLMNPDGSPGIEAEKRLTKAMADSAALLHRRDRLRIEKAEAEKLAVEMNRKARIEKQARSIASMRKDNIE